MNTPTDKLALRADPSGAASFVAEEVTRAVIEAATFEAHRRVLKATIAAEWDLGRDTTDDCRELAHASYQGPTVIFALHIAANTSHQTAPPVRSGR